MIFKDPSVPKGANFEEKRALDPTREAGPPKTSNKCGLGAIGGPTRSQTDTKKVAKKQVQKKR